MRVYAGKPVKIKITNVPETYNLFNAYGLYFSGIGFIGYMKWVKSVSE